MRWARTGASPMFTIRTRARIGFSAFALTFWALIMMRSQPCLAIGTTMRALSPVPVTLCTRYSTPSRSGHSTTSAFARLAMPQKVAMPYCGRRRPQGPARPRHKQPPLPPQVLLQQKELPRPTKRRGKQQPPLRPRGARRRRPQQQPADQRFQLLSRAQGIHPLRRRLLIMLKMAFSHRLHGSSAVTCHSRSAWALLASVWALASESV
mmetsp:Transcript_48484/g.96485  ORF Transcript_48484/g.96485 Transcript_48484/m.96485 type:complete len:208 (-) Transcript_48484:296-919(-)